MNGGTSELGRMFLVLGGILIVAGLLLTVGSRFGLGQLPGDLEYRKVNVSFHFPIVTSILLSILLTIVLNLFFRR